MSRKTQEEVADHAAVLGFWFEELKPAQHFRKSAALDQLIRERFLATHGAAARGELSAWRDSPEGRLAEIIVLDQFSRNLYRDDARAFACDGMALALAQEAVRAGADQALPPPRRAFLYMPYMHSESSRIHETALQLFSQPGLEYSLKFEREHRELIERFGRYPRRNAALGRVSTTAEKAYLAEPGAGF
ncbi:MAG: DUF924 family protein [Gammaproteobacteria bacterium]